MDIFEAYRAGDRLCFYLTGFKDSARLIAAMVKHKDGIAVADANVYDPLAGKCTALLAGDVTGEGPWKIGRFTVEFIDGNAAVEDQLEIVENLPDKPSLKDLETWLKEQF